MISFNKWVGKGLNPFEIRAWFGRGYRDLSRRRGQVLIPLKSGLGSDVRILQHRPVAHGLNVLIPLKSGLGSDLVCAGIVNTEGESLNPFEIRAWFGLDVDCYVLNDDKS